MYFLFQVDNKLINIFYNNSPYNRIFRKYNYELRLQFQMSFIKSFERYIYRDLVKFIQKHFKAKRSVQGLPGCCYTYVYPGIFIVFPSLVSISTYLLHTLK